MTSAEDELRIRIEREGFALRRGVVGPGRLEALSEALDALEREDEGGLWADRSARRRGPSVYGQRDLLGRLTQVADLARSPEILSLVEAVLGSGAFPVRGLLFDKNPGANWGVPWHRDLTIAVAARVEAPGYRGWSVKAGVQHVQPPVTVLERVLTLRLHVDDAGPDNAPLRVLPGSHHLHGVDPTELEPWRSKVEPVVCLALAGDVLLMRPLLLHASSPSASPSRRRVVHLEFAVDPLPGGPVWQVAADRMEPRACR